MIALLTISGGLGSPAFAADWPQFRGDARKTAASTDRVALPLVPLWSWTGRAEDPPFWKGRCFVLTGLGRSLHSLDARTGDLLWTTELAGGFTSSFPNNKLFKLPDGIPYTHRIGPAVSEAGLVIIPGRCSLPKSTFQRHLLHGLVACDAHTGKVIVSSDPLHVQRPHEGDPPKPPVQSIQFQPNFRGWSYNRTLLEPEAAKHHTGPLALHGQSVLSTSPWGGLLLWTPGQPLNFWGLHAGDPVFRADLATHSSPVTMTDMGFVFGAPFVQPGRRKIRVKGENPKIVHLSHHRGPVLLMFHQNIAPRWWRIDLPCAGILTYHRGALFTRMQSRIISIDASTGGTRWIFPPGPFQRERPDARPYIFDSGLVAKDQKIYGEVGNSLVCLDQQTGQPLWRLRLRGPLAPRSLVASRDHLFACEGLNLIAVDAKTGARLWSQPLSRPGSLAIANGMLYVTTDDRLEAFAPAERTFRLALDSPHPNDYSGKLGEADLLPPPVQPGMPDLPVIPEMPNLAEPGPPMEQPDADALPEAADPKIQQEPDPAPEGPNLEFPPQGIQIDSQAVADASVLRLPGTEEEATLLQRARTRRQQCGDVPLLLSLEWTDPQRSRALLLPDAQLLLRCRKLAETVRPEYFDLAPDLNVYLTFQPDRAEALLQWITEARAAIRQVSPGTKVLVSLNREVLSRIYGNGKQRPFGELPARRLTLETLHPFLAVVDAVGLTSHPQSAFVNDRQIPGDYFRSVRGALGTKPLLLTDLVLHAAPGARLELWGRRLIQAAYWLNAELLVYPDLRGEVPPVAPPLGRERPLPVLGAWADVPFWKRVPQLTAAPESFK